MMKRIAMPVPFEDRTVSIRYTDDFEKMNGKFSPVTTEFIKNGYVVLRNFIPKEIIDMTLDAWKVIERDPSHNEHFFHTEKDITDNSPKDSLFKSQGSYNFPPSIALHRWMRDNLDKVFDFKLVETYSFTRKYDRGAYLRAHTDRPSCEISATVCLDYHCDDGKPWSIWVQNEEDYIDLGCMEKAFKISQGLPHRKRKGIQIDLEVGDVLLYQGPNIPHWRDTFLGDYSSHMFLHFINANSNMNGVSTFTKPSHAPNDRSQRSAFTYDGAENRYSIEQNNEHFINASNFWENYANRLKVDPSLPPASEIINNYSMIKTTEEKKKK